jgi:outer membrane lipoprotein-sorting protein
MRRALVTSLVTVAFAAGLLAAVLAVPARGEVTLPQLTPAELIAKMAAEVQDVQAVHGEFSWTNRLLGDGPLRLPAGAPEDAEALLPSGTGEVWYQDGRARVQMADGEVEVTAVKSGAVAWFYRSLNNTALRVALPAEATAADHWSHLDKVTPFLVGLGLARLAPAAGVDVGQETVAGRAAYVLIMTPTSELTTLDSATLAVDGQTFVPLRVEVFARGQSDPVFSAGFTSVEYDPVDTGIFAYAPPAGATVERHAAAEYGERHEAEKNGARPDMPAAITLEEARGRVDFPVAALADPVAGLAFQDARVLTGEEGPGPAVALRYGAGFGTVALVEAEVPAAAYAMLLGEMRGFSAAGSTTVDGADVRLIETPLFNAAVWQEDGVTLAAGGLVSQETLRAFVAGVR